MENREIKGRSPLPSEGDHPLLPSRQPCHASNFTSNPNLLSLVGPSYEVPTSRPLSKPWDYVRAGTIYLPNFQLPYLLPGCPAGLLAGWMQAITRLQQQKIAQRLRIQPSAKQPNRRGESGICVELPTAFLIRDYPPPCLGVPRRISPTPNTNPARRQQIRIGRMLSISTSSLAWT